MKRRSPIGQLCLRAIPELPLEPTHLHAIGWSGSVGKVVPSAADIIHAAAVAGRVDPGLMLSNNLTKPVVRARQCAMLMLRRWLCLSYPEIARLLNQTAHAACMQSIRVAAVSAHGLLNSDQWALRIIEQAAIHLFDYYAYDAIHLAVPPLVTPASR